MTPLWNTLVENPVRTGRAKCTQNKTTTIGTFRKISINARTGHLKKRVRCIREMVRRNPITVPRAMDAKVTNRVVRSPENNATRYFQSTEKSSEETKAQFTLYASQATTLAITIAGTAEKRKASVRVRLSP